MSSVKSLRNLDPYEFEELIAEVWKARGYNTKVRKKSNDRGVDIEARDGENLEVIQAKRYSADNKVGSQAVRNYATLYQQIPEADTVVIVTSGEFTGAARDLAKDLNVEILNGRELLDEMQDNGIELVTEVSYQQKSNHNSGEKTNRTSSNTNPFINESDFIKISSNQGYIDSCRECDSESVWYGQRSYLSEKYTYLKCDYCDAIWISSETISTKSPDDWVRIEAENDLLDGEIREEIQKESSARREDSSCFIATAAYGTPHADEIDVLRNLRDEVLLQNLIGKYFVGLYYQYSPPVANWISDKEWRKKAVRGLIIVPSVRFSEYILSR